MLREDLGAVAHREEKHEAVERDLDLRGDMTTVPGRVPPKLAPDEKRVVGVVLGEAPGGEHGADEASGVSGGVLVQQQVNGRTEQLLRGGGVALVCRHVNRNLM